MSSFQVLIIEPLNSHAHLISDILRGISDDVEIIHFTDVKQFVETYRKASADLLSKSKSKANTGDNEQKTESEDLKEEKEAEIDLKSKPSEDEVVSFDFSQVQLILADMELTHNVDQLLWKKFLRFLDKHHEESGHKTRFLYTGFSSGEEFNPRDYHSDVVFNILIKPYDPVIVGQILSLALVDDGPIRVEDIYQQEEPALIELIKDIEIDRLTELGFRTKSRREIEINKIARYFGAPFEEGKSNSLFAYCYKNYEISQDPSEFVCSFSYLGISKEQLGSIRRVIQSDPKSTEYPFSELEAGTEKSEARAILIARDESFGHHLTSVLNEKIVGMDLTVMTSPVQLLEQLPVERRGELDGAEFPRIFNTEEPIVIRFSSTFQEILGITWAEVKKENETPPEALIDLNTLDIFDQIRKDKRLKAPVTLQANHQDHQLLLKVLKLEEVIDPEEGNAWALSVQEPSDQERHAELTQGSSSLEQIDAVFIHFDSMSERTFSLVFKAVQLLAGEGAQPSKFFLLSNEAVSSYDRMEAVSQLDDVFQLPIDIYYLARKIKMHCPQIQLKNQKDNSRKGIELKEGIKTAMPLIVDSISEVHVSFKYPRAIRITDVRRLSLWLPNTKEMPEILAICRYCEKLSEGSYQCDFMFFAVQEKQLRHLRQWIKQNYVHSKQSEDEA